MEKIITYSNAEDERTADGDGSAEQNHEDGLLAARQPAANEGLPPTTILVLSDICHARMTASLMPLVIYLSFCFSFLASYITVVIEPKKKRKKKKQILYLLSLSLS